MRLFFLSVSLLAVSAAASAQQSEAFVEQVGSLNVASLTQFGSRATLHQLGTGQNVALLEQTDGALATILQNGTNNRLFGLDAFGAGLADSAALQADGSRLILSQTGTDNTAYVQQAFGAVALITQNGTGNTATIIQM